MRKSTIIGIYFCVIVLIDCLVSLFSTTCVSEKKHNDFLFQNCQLMVRIQEWLKNMLLHELQF